MQSKANHQTWPAPAKLNLFLHVTGRRADGYHRLQTLFQLLDWGDQLSIALTPQPEIVRRRDIGGVSAEHDLSIRAARLLQAKCSIDQGARIAVTKNIPQGSGLGGASSDAATALLVLNQLWNCGLDVQELAELGLRLGADVPLFIHGHSAWGESVGERLVPVELGPRHYVVVFPGIRIATARVFADPGLKRNTPELDPSLVLASGRFSGLRNDCMPVALKLSPELDRIRADLATWGDWKMTGTGSALFLPVEKKNHALQLTTELKCRYNVRAVKGVDRSPLTRMLSMAK